MIVSVCAFLVELYLLNLFRCNKISLLFSALFQSSYILLNICTKCIKSAKILAFVCPQPFKLNSVGNQREMSNTETSAHHGLKLPAQQNHTVLTRKKILRSEMLVAVSVFLGSDLVYYSQSMVSIFFPILPCY